MKEFITNFSAYAIPLGVLAAAVTYVITQIKTGGSKASTEVISTYREQVTQLKGELKDQADSHTRQMNELTTNFTKQISELTARVGELTGSLKSKDDQILELKNLLLEKSPEMIEFYKKGNKYFTEAQPILTEIKTHLQNSKV